MNLEPLNLRSKVREAIALLFLASPVELLQPVIAQLAQIAGLKPIARSRADDFVRETGTREPLPQVGELGIGDVDFERGNGHRESIRGGRGIQAVRHFTTPRRTIRIDAGRRSSVGRAADS